MPEKKIVCYCLKSSVSRRTYVGASVNFTRRLRQHNGELVGGSKYTSSNRPWVLVYMVEGFSSWKQALSFEWQWKKVKCKYGSISPIERRKKCVDILLKRDRWKDKNLILTKVE